MIAPYHKGISAYKKRGVEYAATQQLRSEHIHK